MARKKSSPPMSADDALGIWISIGAGVGAALGLIYGNVAAGTALGAGLGTAIGSLEWESARKRGGTQKP